MSILHKKNVISKRFPTIQWRTPHPPPCFALRATQGLPSVARQSEEGSMPRADSVGRPTCFVLRAKHKQDGKLP
jgi:hypothetical protein